VGAEAAEDDDEVFEDKAKRLTAKLKEQFDRVRKFCSHASAPFREADPSG
jgi:hypothetical protein